MFPSSHFCKQCCIDVFAQSSSGTGVRNSLGYIPQNRIAESKHAARCLCQILPDCSQDTHLPFHAVAHDHLHCCMSSLIPGIEGLESLPIRECETIMSLLSRVCVPGVELGLVYLLSFRVFWEASHHFCCSLSSLFVPFLTLEELLYILFCLFFFFTFSVTS